VIILTLLGDEDVVVKCLEMGANDYIVKPFRKMEFLARIKSLVRGQGIVHAGNIFQKGFYRLDISNHNLYFKDQKITLTRNEYLIFYKLIRNSNRIVTTPARQEYGEKSIRNDRDLSLCTAFEAKNRNDPSGRNVLETKTNLLYLNSPQS
jgi:DNA-binding response OmpR family regulator